MSGPGQSNEWLLEFPLPSQPERKRKKKKPHEQHGRAVPEGAEFRTTDVSIRRRPDFLGVRQVLRTLGHHVRRFHRRVQPHGKHTSGMLRTRSLLRGGPPVQPTGVIRRLRRRAKKKTLVLLSPEFLSTERPRFLEARSPCDFTCSVLSFSGSMFIFSVHSLSGHLWGHLGSAPLSGHRRGLCIHAVAMARRVSSAPAFAAPCDLCRFSADGLL